MTFQKLISICKPLDVYGSKPEQIGNLTQDSRTVEQGDVFIAVKGIHVDGHDFIEDAIERGAAAVICEKAHELSRGVCTIQVERTRPLVGLLAQSFEEDPAESLKIIGITGTNGKTTTATLVYQTLQKLGVQASLLGTVEKRINQEVVDSQLTTADPVELAGDMRRMVEAGSTHLVMEVSSHALQQKRVAGIEFDVTAFTNLSHDHLDYHTDMDEYAEAKKLLFDGLSAEATAVLNDDDEYADQMITDCSAEIVKLTFNEETNTEDVACQVISTSSDGIELIVDGTKISSPLTGNFNAYNLAQSFLICRALGYEEQKIAQALGAAKGAPGRLERVSGPSPENQPAVFVDYAHTPAALENVLQTLAEFKEESQRLQVVFGCGGDRDKAKRPEMAAISERFADKITVTSDNPRSEERDAIIDEIMSGFRQPGKVHRVSDRRKAIKESITQADASMLILIAGKGHETYQEVKGVRHHFDDREIAREALGCTNGNSKTKEAR